MPRRKTPEPFAVEVGARLRARRNALGLSLAKLAKRLGIPKSAGWLSSVEQGRVMLTIESLAKLARALHVAPGELLPALANQDGPGSASAGLCAGSFQLVVPNAGDSLSCSVCKAPVSVRVLGSRPQLEPHAEGGDPLPPAGPVRSRS